MHNNKKIIFFLKSDKIFALFLKISSLCCEVEQAFSTFFGYCINIFQKSPSNMRGKMKKIFIQLVRLTYSFVHESKFWLTKNPQI